MADTQTQGSLAFAAAPPVVPPPTRRRRSPEIASVRLRSATGFPRCDGGCGETLGWYMAVQWRLPDGGRGETLSFCERCANTRTSVRDVVDVRVLARTKDYMRAREAALGPLVDGKPMQYAIVQLFADGAPRKSLEEHAEQVEAFLNRDMNTADRLAGGDDDDATPED